MVRKEKELAMVWKMANHESQPKWRVMNQFWIPILLMKDESLVSHMQMTPEISLGMSTTEERDCETGQQS